MPTMMASRRSIRVRRLVANLLILAGLLVVAYPVGTWVYTYWQQYRLEQRLVEASPVFAVPMAELFTGEMTTPTEGRLGIAAAEQALREAEREAELGRFAQAADDFERSIGNKGAAPLGKMIIPKIGVDTVVIEGVGKTDLREGPGHWPSTPFPGQGGNFVVSGHRTTYGAPFFRLDKLEPGDVVDLVLPYAAVRYTVTRKVIVFPNQVEEVRQRGFEQISLATCHPIYSAKQRLVIQAELESFRLLSDTTPQAASVPPGG